MTGTYAMAESARTHVTAAILSGAGRMVLGFTRRVTAAYLQARTARILSGLDDQALKDIGLHRGQIDSIERDPRYTARFPGF